MIERILGEPERSLRDILRSSRIAVTSLAPPASPITWKDMVIQQRIAVSTSRHGQMHDITHKVAAVVTESGIQKGTVNVFNIGSTGAIGTIEFEPGLQRDYPELLDRLMPPSRDYGHEQAWHDGNGHSHLQATTVGPSITVPVASGTLVLGTWQQIFHLECDIKPRQREIVVTVIGE